MQETIDYYFTVVSPFAYLGHKRLVRLAETHGCTINFKPVDLQGVWQASGSVPLPQRSPVRQRYRLIELQRIAEMHGVALNLHPAHFPTNPQLADLCICAVVSQGGDASGLALDLGRSVWELDRQIADEAVILEVLAANGFDASQVLAKAQTEETEAIRQANSHEAIAADAIGAPSYVYREEVFWGQDRLEYLDHMIRSGRAPFSPKL